MTLRYDTRSRVSTYTQSWVANADPDFGAYESIATTTLSSSTASVTFSSIPQTYKHLQLRLMARDTRTITGNPIDMYVNSDSTYTNYANHYLSGSGSSASSGGGQAASQFLPAGVSAGASAGSNIFGVAVMDFLDYTNTNKYKTVRALSGYDNNGSGEADFLSGVWLNTSAITSILLYPRTSTNFVQYSSFALYGIKA